MSTETAGRRPSRRSALVWAVALAIPVAVLAWSVLAFQRPAEVEGRALMMDRQLKRAGEVDVVVLGSSLARTDIRVDLLATELDLSQRSVAMLTLPNATAAHWYAILKNRVFAGGHRPKAILMVGALTTMVTPDVLKDANVERLVNQLSSDEPVIAAKVFGTDDPLRFRWLFMREQAGILRDRWLTDLRDLSLAMAWRGKGRREAGARLADRANAVVFADENMDYALHKGNATGLSVDAVDQLDLEGLDLQAESLLPDLISLAREHGASAVFVRTPFPPSNPDNDRLPHWFEAEAQTLIEAEGGLYVDLRSLGLDDTQFRDMRHMNREGASRFTRALARSMRDLGALQSEAARARKRQALDVAPDRVVREGRTAVDVAWSPVGACRWRGVLDGGVPALRDGRAEAVSVAVGGDALRPATLDEGCDAPGFAVDDGVLVVAAPTSGPPPEASLASPGVGDLGGWWLPPGGVLRIAFDDPWPHAPDTFSVEGIVEASDPAAVAASLSGEPLPVVATGSVGRLDARPRAPVDRPWDLTLAAADDGGWVFVRHLAVGEAPFATQLTGRPEASDGASVRLVGGRVEDTALTPVFPRAVPDVTGGGALRRAPRGVGVLPAPRLAELADQVSTRAPYANKCSPVRVLEDGVPLPHHHASCAEMATVRGGRVCHAGDALYFTTPDGSDPLRNGRSYTLALDAERLCDRINQRETTPLRGSRWIYPGDVVEIAVPPERFDGMLVGASTLELALDPRRVDPDDALGVTVMHGTEVLLDTEVTAGMSDRVHRSLALARPIPRGATDVVVRVENRDPADAWWLVVLAALVEEGGSANEAEAPAPGTPPVAFAAAPVVGSWPPSTWGRTGAPPEVPDAKRLRQLPSGAWDATVFSLWPVSGSHLRQQGLGWWSPLRLTDRGEPLVSAPRRAAVRQTCTACFEHLGRAVVVRTVDDAEPELVPSLDPGVPHVAPDGAEVVWVYPGGGVQMGFDAPWVGPWVRVRVRAHVLAPQKTQGGEPKVYLERVSAPFTQTEDGWVAEVAVGRAQEGPFAVEIRSPASGPYVLVDEVVVQDVRGRWTAWTGPTAVAEDDGDDTDAATPGPQP